MQNAKPIFITGCYRSGTTVFDKVLHNHPNVIVGSQPFPILYFLAKATFLKEKGIARRYPLDHLFLEYKYTPQSLSDFLDRHIFDENAIDGFFDQMESYSEGLLTPEMTRFRGEIIPGTFWEIYHQLNECIARLFPKDDVRFLGGKEVLCEEYIPHLLGKGVRVVLVIRDPRAMICSLNFRKRDNQTGQNRPVLYSLRAWRKSVAIAFACEKDPSFLSLRYEDFVTEPESVLLKATDFLGLSPYQPDAFAQGIRDQYGEIWQGNSSFSNKDGITTESLNTFDKQLPREVKAFIETATYPEMRAMAYSFTTITDFQEEVLRTYRDPFPSIHNSFPADYSSDPGRIADEIKRVRKVERPVKSDTTDDVTKWFINEIAYQRLCEATSS